MEFCEVCSRNKLALDDGVPQLAVGLIAEAIEPRGFCGDRIHFHAACLPLATSAREKNSIAYESINGLRTEAVQNLSKIRPETLGQAARISGVTPADIALLGIWITRGERAAS